MWPSKIRSWPKEAPSPESQWTCVKQRPVHVVVGAPHQRLDLQPVLRTLYLQNTGAELHFLIQSFEGDIRVVRRCCTFRQCKLRNVKYLAHLYSWLNGLNENEKNRLMC